MRILFFLLSLINITLGGSFVVGYEKDGKTQTFECFAYLAFELQKDPQLLPNFFVTDFESGAKLNPLEAFFVTNSKYKSTCSKYPIIAFTDEQQAQKFAEKYFGNVRDFDFSLFVATKDLSIDLPIISKRLEAKASRGKSILQNYCKNNIAKCSHLLLRDKEDLKYFLANTDKAKTEKNIITIEVPQDAKCPVCGMFVAKYPKWAAQIKCEKHQHFFDGVKDMMKFYFNSEHYGHDLKRSTNKEIFVTDYYTIEKVKAQNAFFVVGSNVYGPMGHELIAFLKFEDAEEFKKSHNGKSILKFSEITPQTIKGLQ